MFDLDALGRLDAALPRLAAHALSGRDRGSPARVSSPAASPTRDTSADRPIVRPAGGISERTSERPETGGCPFARGAAA